MHSDYANFFFFSLILCSILSLSSSTVCTYVNCEPVEQFLATPAPQVIGPQCKTCTECAELNFTICTLVHTKNGENNGGAHCVCGNTLPSSCENDHVRLSDILERDATTFIHDYTCSFSDQDTSSILPKMTIYADGAGDLDSVEIPIESLANSRRFNDLDIRTLSLHVFNESKSELAGDDIPLDPYARLFLGSDGSPVMVFPHYDRVNYTNWPRVTLPNLGYVPSTIAYSIDNPSRRLVESERDSSTVQTVPFRYSRYEDTADNVTLTGSGYVGSPNYTLIVLIIVGVILLLGLCCAFVSCKDKLRHGKYLKTIQNEVAISPDMETGKSAAVSTQPQSYTAIKNGGHDKLVDDHESAGLLSNSDKRANMSTLPLSTRPTGLTDAESTFRPQKEGGIGRGGAGRGVGEGGRGGAGGGDRLSTFPGGVSSLGRGSGYPSGSTTDTDYNQRAPAAVETDRRKYMQLMKDATIINAADLDLLESIGNGEFGVIRRGYVFDRSEAMIHCLRPPHKQSSESKSESLIERLDASVKAGFHPHIVSLLGMCQEGDILYVCLQLETGPSLRNMLRESRSLDQFLQYTDARGRLSLMSPQRLLNIILGIARGMGHLEECQVLHDNLAAVNIVICDNGTPKIAGFGMATLSDLYMRQMEKNHDQLRWLPPETHDTGLFTMKSQTWSFGVVLWEIVTFGATPYYNMSDDEVIRRVAEGHRLHRPSNCSRQLYDLMEQSWRHKGEDRPDFGYIQQHVHELNLDPELHISVVYHQGFVYEPIRESWNM